MKIFIFPLIHITICCWSVWAQTDRIGINGMETANGQVWFAITDSESTNETTAARDLNLESDKPLWFLIGNTSTNRTSFVFCGMSNSFAFDSYSDTGVPIKKTQKGESICAGPANRRDIRASGGKRIGGNGSVVITDFPKLTDLFIYPADGNYWFELRLWTWNQGNKQFELSKPIMLKVGHKQSALENQGQTKPRLELLGCEFETPPLMFTIEPPKPVATNAPPRKPDSK